MFSTKYIFSTTAVLLTLFTGPGSAITRLGPMPHHNFPDPTIIHAEGKWWAFATPVAGSGIKIQVASSTDWFDWNIELNDNGSQYDAMPATAAWVHEGPDYSVWAPDVAKLDDGSYVMYYAAKIKDGNKHCVSAGVSKNVRGPYEPLAHTIVCPDEGAGAFDIAGFKNWAHQGDWTLPTAQSVSRSKCPTKIDGHCGNSHVDNKWSEGGYGGQRYIVYKRQIGGTPITLQPMEVDGVTLEGKPSTLLEAEKGDYGSIEAPSIFKTPKGSYIMTYSKGNTRKSQYTVSVAVSKHLKGPWVRKGDVLKTGNFDLDAPGGADMYWTGERVAFHSMQNDIGEEYEGVRVFHASEMNINGQTGKFNFGV